MVKKAKVSVNGYIKDLKSWFGLMEKRAAFIESGDPNFRITDRVEELSRQLHPDTVKAQICNIRDDTPTTRSFVLRTEAGYEIPFFHAGQHISVKFNIDGKWLTRPFSVSSSPEETKDETLTITIRRKEGGYVTGWIWDNWKVGTKVLFDGAFGDGYWSGIRDTAHIVGLAGGSGITAFRSIAYDMITSGRPQKFTILYGSRNQSDIIFYDELNRLAADSAGSIKIVHILSEPEEGWTGETGFIGADVIKRLVSDWDRVSYFVSGPPAMYDYLETEFTKMGVRKRFIRMEEYGEVDDVTALNGYPGVPTAEIFKIRVRFGLEERIVDASAFDTVVVSLEKAGLAPDTHCRSGACGWCRSLLLEGDIWQRPQSDGVRAADRDMGYFHPCSAYPRSDLTIQVFTRLG